MSEQSIISVICFRWAEPGRAEMWLEAVVKKLSPEGQRHRTHSVLRHGGLREVLPSVERFRDEHQRCLQRAQRREGLLRCNTGLWWLPDPGPQGENNHLKFAGSLVPFRYPLVFPVIQIHIGIVRLHSVDLWHGSGSRDFILYKDRRSAPRIRIGLTALTYHEKELNADSNHWLRNVCGFHNFLKMIICKPQCCGSGFGIPCRFDSWIRDGYKLRIRIRDPDPEWKTKNIFPSANFFGLKYLNSLRIQDGENLDPGWKKLGSGINIPDLQHW